MTPEEKAAIDAVKGENKDEQLQTQESVKPNTNSGTKTKKDQPSASDLVKAAGKTEQFFNEQGKKSKENKSNGGSDVVVSLTNKTLVKFTENHGFFKKGHEQEVSDVAFAIYDKAGVIEKL